MRNFSKTDCLKAGQAARERSGEHLDVDARWDIFIRRHSGYMSVLTTKELNALKKAFAKGYEMKPE